MLAATRHHFSTQDSSEVGRYPSTATRDLENFIIRSLASKVFSDGQSLTSWGKKSECSQKQGLTTTHEISDDCPHSPALQGEIKTKAIFRPKGGREEACRAHPCEEVRTRPFWKPPQARRLCVLSHFILEQLWEEDLATTHEICDDCPHLPDEKLRLGDTEERVERGREGMWE
uniref:uncharacterized protein LOC106993242 isoform X5 n=1 Tax=Macaca mulatta TaxID=9544 RepID=UPI0010A224A6|nr:uncharacterized protein LOC106993242 isoform X5 [Macaca mulatta]